MSEPLKITITKSSGSGLFGRLWDGLRDFADDLLPDDFCLDCVKSFAKGFVKGAFFGVVALLFIAALPAEIAIFVVGAFAIAGIIGAVSLFNRWSSMTQVEKSEAFGSILGGIVAGGVVGPKLPPTSVPVFKMAALPGGGSTLVVAETSVNTAGVTATGAGVLMAAGGGSGGSGPDEGEVSSEQQRLEELSKDPQTNSPNPKSRSEAESIMQAEKEGLVSGARRPKLDQGEPNLDFKTNEGWADIKTPIDPQKRPLDLQAQDIADKLPSYGNDVTVIVDLKNLSPTQKADFLSHLSQSGADLGSVRILNP